MKFNKNMFRKKEDKLSFTIDKTIKCSNGKNFKINDMVKVKYKSYFGEHEEFCGRLSAIYTNGLMDSIEVDSSESCKSKTKIVRICDIIAMETV